MIFFVINDYTYIIKLLYRKRLKKFNAGAAQFFDKTAHIFFKRFALNFSYDCDCLTSCKKILEFKSE